MAKQARQWAVEALIRFHRDRSYSNILLEEELGKSSLDSREKSLATRLFYGVIERELTLDYLLSACCKMKLKRMHPAVLDILRVGAYQIVFMEKIPTPAAVNEMVTLSRRMGQHAASGMVNGVLRGVDRQWRELMDALPDTLDGLEKRHSCPRPLLDEWVGSYGFEKTATLAAHINDIPPHYLRVNTLLTTVEQVTSLLEEAGVSYRLHPHLPGCLEVDEISLLKRVETLPKNWYYYQDMASQWSCLALSAVPGESIADVCAAPGGKSLTVAGYMQNQGSIMACDLYEAKCDVMRRRAAELGVTVMNVRQRDASQPCTPEEAGRFDRVICDAPCSGLGVIRRKPEIRYKHPDEFADLPALQLQILEASAALVRVGGVLQYSTCTLRRAENEEVAAAFLAAHPEFSPRVLPLDVCFERAGKAPSHTLTLFPDEQGTDGFFIAGFTKTR